MYLDLIKNPKKECEKAYNLICEKSDFFLEKKSNRLIIVYDENKIQKFSYININFLI